MRFGRFREAFAGDLLPYCSEYESLNHVEVHYGNGKRKYT